MFKKLTHQLEALFDQEHQQSWLIEQGLFEAQKKYTTDTQIQSLRNLSYVFENGLDESQLNILVESLAGHFEFVFAFKKTEAQKFSPACVGLFGKILSANLKWESTRFPQFSLYKVFRTSARGLFKKLKVSDLDPDEKLVAYLIQVSPQLILLVASSQAEPWIQIKIESLQQTLMKINFQI